MNIDKFIIIAIRVKLMNDTGTQLGRQVQAAGMI